MPDRLARLMSAVRRSRGRRRSTYVRVSEPLESAAAQALFIVSGVLLASILATVSLLITGVTA